MSLIGETLARYRITAAIGAGGMGEVYRATERLARFEREARLLASLNHPGIAHLYGFETAAAEAADPSSPGQGGLLGMTGGHFLAMELVRGEDLQERLQRGRLPLDEALGVARQVAEALEAAHEKGIVHRDLKPANVKLTPDGKVKVLDFGLAKAWAGDAASGTGP